MSASGKLFGIFYMVCLVAVSDICYAQSHLTTYILVRHADRTGNDDELSDQGYQRALELSRVLSDVQIDVIYSSDYLRTITTVEPLSKSRKIELIKYDAQDIPGLVKRLKSDSRRTILIVGHSNTIPQTINELGVKPSLSDLAHDAYDRLFIVSQYKKKPPKLLTLQFGEDTP